MDIIDSINGIEASRRVGWAKYYSAQEEIDSLRSALQALADLVIYDPRIRNTDEILIKAQQSLRL